MPKIDKILVKCPICKLIQDLRDDMYCRGCDHDLTPWELYRVDSSKVPTC